MTEQNQAADYESALDTEQAEAKSNITITESAQGYLADLLAKQDTDGIGVRIFVEHPGTPRAECCMAYNNDSVCCLAARQVVYSLLVGLYIALLIHS